MIHCTKKPFASRAAAMKEIAKHYKINKSHRRPYVCEDCANGTWHVTSQVKKMIDMGKRPVEDEFDSLRA